MSDGPAESKPDKLVVYGTLMKGKSNHHHLKGARFLGHDTLKTITLYDIGPYPGAKFEASGGIEVEVYRLNESLLKLIDDFEEVDRETPHLGLYGRRVCDTCYGPAWVYIFNQSVEGLESIRSGAWEPSL